MKDVDYTKLFAEADYNISKTKKDDVKFLVAQDDEKMARTEKLADSIQNMIVGILKRAQSNTGHMVEIEGLQEYGTPKDVGWSIDDEKLEVMLDFSYSFEGVSCKDPKGFDYYHQISWEYLENILKKYHIQINRKQEENVEEAKKWYHISFTKCTDIITITLGRQLDNQEAPNIEPQKTK